MVIASFSHWTFRFRSTLQNRREHTVQNAKSIKSIRSHSTRRVKTHLPSKEREDMMPSRRDTVVSQSPSSERSQKPQRRLLSNLSAVHAREEEWLQSSVARHSSSERRKSQREAQSSDQRTYWSFFNNYISQSISLFILL